MRTRAKHSNVTSFDHDACIVQFVFEARNEDASKALKCFSFDHDEGSILQFAFEARKDPKQRDLNHQDQYRSTRTREDEQDEEKQIH